MSMPRQKTSKRKASRLADVPDVLKPEHPWERQRGESEKTFQAFRHYLELGPERSLKAVAQECTKSIPLIKRWSAQWEWSNRVSQYTNHLAREIDQKAEKDRTKRLPYILSSWEVLARATFLASASLDMVLDENGFFDIAKARKTGGLHALGRLKVRRYIRRFKVGTPDEWEEETVVHELALRDKNYNIELLGRHHDLWTGEIKDPRGLLAEILGISKEQLLPTLGDWTPGRLLEPFEPPGSS